MRENNSSKKEDKRNLPKLNFYKARIVQVKEKISIKKAPNTEKDKNFLFLSNISKRERRS